MNSLFTVADMQAAIDDVLPCKCGCGHPRCKVAGQIERLTRTREGIAALAEANAELRTQVQSLESMRPHWAQGFTDDSVAAQTQAIALSQLWALLGAQNQTDAMRVLTELVGLAETAGGNW